MGNFVHTCGLGRELERSAIRLGHLLFACRVLIVAGVRPVMTGRPPLVISSQAVKQLTDTEEHWDRQTNVPY
jgi:hypothetical protein